MADMPLLKVVVSSTRNSTETVAALERDLDRHSPSISNHDDDDHELVENKHRSADELSQVNLKNVLRQNPKKCICMYKH